MQLREMSPADWPAVRRIYQEGIDGGNATFEVTAPQQDEWDAKHLPVPRLVVEEGGQVTGWAALSRVSARAVYRGVCEVSVYVDGAHQGRGIGRLLLAELIRRSEAEGIWTLQASIFPENEASIELHRRLGFRVVGRRERIAQHRGRWRDTVLMERRSPSIG